MSDTDEASEAPGTVLCKSCGLCCSGHLFAWVKLRSLELEPVQALGVNVIREPRQRGFSQPCPLWNGVCTIYTSPHYPRSCDTYKCKLLKNVLDETVALPEALIVVGLAKEMINELELLLPASSNSNFRERLIGHLEYLEGFNELGNADLEFRQKARTLLNFYRDLFGVKDIVDDLDEI
jgi:uncharacterized protein